MTETNQFKQVILLLLAVLFSNLVFSKENFIPGYIIKNTGDTIKGYIDYRDWNKNPEYVNFKTNLNATSVSFFPLDIKLFSVHSEIYESGIVEVENTSLSNESLEVGFQSKITVDTVFLQTLVKGEKSLYFYKNPDGRNNFYIPEANGFKLLMYIKYLRRSVNGQNIVTVYDRYIFQLANYLDRCKNIKELLKDAGYTKNKLLKLFGKYYECSSSKAEYQDETNKIQTEIGLLAGVSSTTLEFTSGKSVFKYLTKVDYGTSTDFTGGLACNIVIPKMQNKLSIDNELVFSSYKLRGVYNDISNKDIYEVTTTEFNYSYLKINNLLSFRFYFGNISFFVKGGMSNGLAISEKYNEKKETTIYSLYHVYRLPALRYVKKMEGGLVCSTGLKYKKLSGEFRFEKGHGMSGIINLASTAKRYYFLLGYWFK